MIAAQKRVTTTDTISGWDIHAHLGIVGTQAVAGTWFGSDWLAGLSDVFGGRSGTYQRQLDALYSAALSELVQKAESRGANWVVGVHVDFDEISGGGKQMFMVSLSGTAVLAQPVERSLQLGPISASSAPQEHVTRRIRRMAIRETPTIFTAEDLSFLREEGAAECAGAVAAGVAQQEGRFFDAELAIWNDFSKYFSSIPPSDAADALYRLLSATGPGAKAAAFVIGKCGLIDYSRINAFLLAEQDFVKRKVGVALIAKSPTTYTPSDIDALGLLALTLRDRGFFVPETRSKKAMLRQSEYTVWVCLQGHESMEGLPCTTCGVSPSGYFEKDFSVERALTQIGLQVNALRELFAVEAKEPAATQ